MSEQDVQQSHILPENFPAFKAEVMQLLDEGLLREDIVSRLSSRYKTPRDIAKAVACIPRPSDSERYQPVRLVLIALALLALGGYLLCIALSLYASFVTSQETTSTTIARWIVMMVGFAPGPSMLLMFLLLLRENQGKTYILGTLAGFIMITSSLGGVLGPENTVELAVDGYFVAMGVLVGMLSCIVWRKYFPDVFFIRPVMENGTERYVFKADRRP